jgi:hypothetical protein
VTTPRQAPGMLIDDKERPAVGGNTMQVINAAPGDVVSEDPSGAEQAPAHLN